ncbi:hypothetical protein F511_15888 [Dorcoceras hygrometricum]|uniref:Uncharacterized protein n=1 Tax=Dorcoceras hygrometricum TaxID=472368 RepID=A0A2Z7C9K6_9LAMI|nr:hypothetical protein F511_15888 [Dorcoceras hygrometricum]
MASSLIQNFLQVNFDSVMSLFEVDLESFFSNTVVKEDSVISCVQGKFVEIFEEQFAGVFGLPTEGLISVDEVPKELINAARKAFSANGELIKTSCKKKKMKVEFRLLNDILEKTVTVKAGSFDAVTHERFLLMAAIMAGLKSTGANFYEIPKTSQISMPTVVLPIDFTDSIAQLRASIDQIRLEKLSTFNNIDKLKAALSGKITNLEMAFSQTNTRQDIIFRTEIHDIRNDIEIQKAAFTQELTTFRLETQEGFNTLSAQFSENISYINRGRDEKKGKESSRGPPSDDRIRPCGGGGSSSEPSRKRGGSHRGRGSRSSGLSSWFS